MATGEEGPVSEPSAETISEAIEQPGLDVVVRHWLRIAAVAWHGYLLQGRGMVMVSNEASGVSVSYHPGSPCGCFEALIAKYNPEQTVVLMVNGEVYDFIGNPTPKEAESMATADAVGVSTH